MSVLAPPRETTPVGITDIIDWSEAALTLLTADPREAQEQFSILLQSAELQEQDRPAAFAHAALIKTHIKLEGRGQTIDHTRKLQAKLNAITDEKEAAYLYQTIGAGLQFAGKSTEALNAYRQAASRFVKIKDVTQVAACYSALGSLHLERNQHDQALSSLLKACQLTFALNDQHALANNYFQLAAVYFEQDLLDQALAYAHKSLEAAQLASDDIQIGNAYNMLGVLNKYMDQPEQALRLYGEALVIRRSHGDVEGEADIQHNIGLIYEAADKHQEALHYYAQAMALRKEINDTGGLLRSFAVLGTTHAKLRHYDLAARYLKRALEHAQDNGEKLMESNLYRELSDVHAQLGDYERAFNYHRQFADLRHSIFNESRLGSFAEAQSKHAAAQDERRADRYRARLVQVEKEVSALNRDLDAALAREADKAEQLQLAKAREEEIAGLKSQIIRVVSHEFRTPLAIISNASYMLERFENKMDSEKKLENHQRIGTAVGYMKELLDDVCWIDAATTEAVAVTPTAITLRQIAASVLDQFIDSAETSDRIQFTFPEVDKRVMVDEGLVKQILYHLVSNALKFSETTDGEPAAPVRITLHHRANQLLLVIKDNGIGIPADAMPRIYELFYRAENAEDRRGLGLGLSIVRRLIDVLNGNVRIESDGEGQGTTALVAIPCRLAS